MAIHQDYLIRMIQEIISLLVAALMNKRKIREKAWEEYDAMSHKLLGFSTRELLGMEAGELIARYADDEERCGKLELAAANMLKMAEEVEDNILLKSRLRQESLQLLTYLQQEGDTFSLQREYLIKLIQANGQ
ncbi:MAG: hypothetical protein IJ511_02520 [Bacteroides sp.]|nr:hypothetical protein [Bacteroides sp.]